MKQAAQDKQIAGHLKNFHRVPQARLPRRIHYWMLQHRTLDRLNWIRISNEPAEREATRWMLQHGKRDGWPLGAPAGNLPD